jgi:hypothetical protein
MILLPRWCNVDYWNSTKINLKKAWQLSGSERWLLVQVFLALPLVALGLRCWGLHRLQARVEPGRGSGPPPVWPNPWSSGGCCAFRGLPESCASGLGLSRIFHEKFLKEERVSAKMLKSPNKQPLRRDTLWKQSAISSSPLKAFGWQGYSFLDALPYRHEWLVPGSGKEAPKVLSWVHTLIANIKGNIRGVHHGVSQKHLPRYLAEFCYRFNRRFWEPQMFNRMLQVCVNTSRITFSELRQ